MYGGIQSLPNGVTSMGVGAFSDCSNLTGVEAIWVTFFASISAGMFTVVFQSDNNHRQRFFRVYERDAGYHTSDKLFGILISVKPAHLKNALSPMFVTLSGILIFARLVHSRN